MQIDKVKGVEDQQRLVTDMLDFVGEQIDKRTENVAGKEWSPANTIDKPLNELTSEEVSGITKDKSFASICKAYGYA